jgi:hypothetical protein
MSRAANSEYDVSEAKAVPETARVRHFDELDDAAQEYLYDVTTGGSPRDPSTLSGLQEGDVVVFTEYLRVG